MARTVAALLCAALSLESARAQGSIRVANADFEADAVDRCLLCLSLSLRLCVRARACVRVGVHADRAFFCIQ